MSIASEHNCLQNALHSRSNISTFALLIFALFDSHFTVWWIGRGGTTEWLQLNPRPNSCDFQLWGWAEGEVYQDQNTRWTGHNIFEIFVAVILRLLMEKPWVCVVHFIETYTKTLEPILKCNPKWYCIINIYWWKLLRNLKWQIPGKRLAARYNWFQGPVPGRGLSIEKHWSNA